MTHLNVSHLRKRFGSTIAVDDVSMGVEKGEIVCLLGPSGCGKTTLLRLVAGLETADSGAIQLDGQDLATVPTFQRDIGMMFQSYALFPHMNVAENIGYGLKMVGVETNQIASTVKEMLELVDLEGLDHRRVDQLSGGQQQRVALARSLATQPSVLLLDEPLGSLDRLLREKLLEELRAILKKVGVTALYVTHDQSEAFGIGDRVAVMNEGKIEQVAPPREIYTAPATRFVATFLGLSNIVPAADGWLEPDQDTRKRDGFLLIPPYAASLQYKDGEDMLKVSATINYLSFRGRFMLLNCDIHGRAFEFSFDPYLAQTGLNHRDYLEGSQIDLWLSKTWFVSLDR